MSAKNTNLHKNKGIFDGKSDYDLTFTFLLFKLKQKNILKKQRMSRRSRRDYIGACFLYCPCPSASDSPVDDLWRALSSSVIGRHVCSLCGNKSRTEAETSQDFCGLFTIAEKSSDRGGGCVKKWGQQANKGGKKQWWASDVNRCRDFPINWHMWW